MSGQLSALCVRNTTFHARFTSNEAMSDVINSKTMTQWVGLNEGLATIAPFISENPLQQVHDDDPDDAPVKVNPRIDYTIRCEQVIDVSRYVKIPTNTGGTPPLNGFAPQEMFKVIFDPLF